MHNSAQCTTPRILKGLPIQLQQEIMQHNYVNKTPKILVDYFKTDPAAARGGRWLLSGALKSHAFEGAKGLQIITHNDEAKT